LNLIGHIAVARRIGSHPHDADVVALGSVVPDLAAWGRFRLTGRHAQGTALGHGISIHHQTDTEFHSHRWFVDIQTQIRSALESAGVGRGPARACAHVGTEMLIDGTLHQDPQIAEATSAALGVIGSAPRGLTQIVAPDTVTDWERHLGSVVWYGIPVDYHDPHAVAARLGRILNRRPRLRLDPNDVGVVAAILNDHHPNIVDSAHQIVDDVVAVLTDHN